MAAIDFGGTAGDADDGGSRSFSHKWPPMLALLVSLAIALLILPSSLNLPQSNPSTTLEYAPVPPSDQDPPPPDESSNLSSLGIAGNSSQDGDGAAGGGQEAKKPDQFVPEGLRCYGDPPRQTEDPLSPPCVSVFTGDNFGQTYQGVTGDEITILIYADGSSPNSATGTNSYTNTSRGDEQNPVGPVYWDVNDEPKPDDHILLRAARVWQTYFNSRYQLYGRKAHFYIYFSGSDGDLAVRRADAEENASGRTIPKPFAIIDTATFEGNNQAYWDGMARRGVLFFGSEALLALPNAFYAKYAPQVWGFYPDIEHKADQFVSYICKNMVPYPVTLSGNGNAGQPRKWGLLRTTDARFPNLRMYTDFVKEGVKACGVDIGNREYTYPIAGITVAAGRVPDYAYEGAAQMKLDGTTTLIWPGGQETYYSRAMADAQYFPEWIISGDSVIDGFFSSQFQDARSFQYAWILSNVIAQGRDEDTAAFKAYRDADPNGPSQDVNFPPLYRDLAQLFQGIQISGPDLKPSNVARGFEAIPENRSSRPDVPAMFFDPGDYTAVKDTYLAWWDPSAQPPTSSQPGCWRLMWGGQRFLAGEAPPGNHFEMREPVGTPNEQVCQGYDQGILLSAGPGA